MKRLRCALIGADTLLIECGRLLRERGHEIVSVAAGSERVATWATQSGLAARDVNQLDVWASELSDQSVDYIFAITHLHLLPKSLVAAAREMAINFHDGPLPEYAGLNTPVWGLLRGETEWGVTWHRIDTGVDTGDIVVQRRFAVAERDTSLSLNTRNFEVAIDSFSELVDVLEADAVVARAQDTSASKAAFKRADRPDGVLNFTQSSADVDRVVRALHFGPHQNLVAAAVLWNPIAAVVVGSSELAETRSPAEPGTVLAANESGLTVACAVGAIVLGDLRWLDGTQCTALEFMAAAGAAVGETLPQLTAEQRTWLADFASTSQPREASVAAQLASMSAAEFPWPRRPEAGTTGNGRRLVAIVPLTDTCTPERISLALASMLARLTPDGGAHVALGLALPPAFARPLICSEAVFDPTAQQLGDACASGWYRDLVARTPNLAGRRELLLGLNLPIGIRVNRNDAPLPQSDVVLQPSSGAGWEIEYDSAAVDEKYAVEFARCVAATVAAADASLLPEAEHDRVVQQWNATDKSYESACIHELIAKQVAATPRRQAILCGTEALTYQELSDRAARLAARLQQLGVGPDSLVGVHVARSVELVVAVLAVLQAGGAYVPLDPAYPADRLRHMIADSDTRVIVCQERDRSQLPLPIDGLPRSIVAIDVPFAECPVPVHAARADNLAYCIYTSGSSGTPKGVLVEHRNVANLFAAMDSVITRAEDETWCAVTSLSFDISVLELLYTLARGMRIVLYVPDTHRALGTAARKAMDFSLFYFSAEEAGDRRDKYRLLLEGARFADANGFCAVWTPERHFHSFGGLYPNPAVTAAAIATVTERISIRAGSVVLPLHHPVEIAEAWSMVDNLSNGRAGVSFASGWQPNDFVLRPQNYANAKVAMYEGIEQVRRLWRGESVAFDGPNGEAVNVATLPRPVQPELPMWITTAGNPESFAAAGTAGTNLLTHLVGQSIEQLASKIASYRAARAAAGHDPATGIVTLMLHAFVGDDEATVRRTVREPLRQYLNTSYNLLREHAWAFPTFRRPDGGAVTNPDDLVDDDMASLAGDDLDAVLDFAAERYYASSGLFGTSEQVLPIVERLHQVGVDEIACLIDFGVDTDTVLDNLANLARVLEAAQQDDAPAVIDEVSIAELVTSTKTTHIQCTPSMARMFTHDPAMRIALSGVRHLLVGGEALPTDLAHELQSLVGGVVTNMYGPTETTVWSSTWQLAPNIDWTPIGQPIANTQLYVLDEIRQPSPIGVAGHLWIGGEGVARGYHQRADLTAERFAPDPFRPGGRVYRTGDLARWHEQPDGGGLLEFIGRADQQVKLRGHRVELGEIEAAIRQVADVDDCAVVVVDPDDERHDQQLVAYVVTGQPATFDSASIREQLRLRLPEVMVPNQVIVLPALPRTPNGKLDRRALPTRPTAATAEVAPPTSEIEQQVLTDWQNVLSTKAIGIDDNFFDAGGHSLLVVRLHRQLQQTLGRPIALTDLYRFPTVRTFADSLISTSRPAAIDTALDRAARRRAITQARS